MKKIKNVSLALLGYFIVLLASVGCTPTEKSKNPFEAPDLSGVELESFLNAPFRYSSVNHNERIKNAFYAGNHEIGYNISMPKLLGKDSKTSRIGIIITEEDKPVTESNMIIEFNHYKDGTIALNRVICSNNGSTENYGQFNDINNALLQVYPDDFFVNIANRMDDLRKSVEEKNKEIAEREAAERAARITPEGWPVNSVYTSVLLLREGVLDFKNATVGQIFYSGNRKEGVSVNPPRSTLKNEVITITSVVNRVTSRFNIFLLYNSSSQMSLIEKIEIRDGTDGKTRVATTFDEKYMVLMILLPALINEGNVGF